MSLACNNNRIRELGNVPADMLSLAKVSGLARRTGDARNENPYAHVFRSVSTPILG